MEGLTALHIAHVLGGWERVRVTRDMLSQWADLDTGDSLLYSRLRERQICSRLIPKVESGSHICYLLSTLDSARFEFTLKMRLNRIWPKDPTYAIFLKSWVFKDVKYDIPMCQYHSTRPQPIQLVPTMQKKLFTSSFQAKFLKIGFTKVTATSIKSYVAANFFVPQSQLVLGACFGP